MATRATWTLLALLPALLPGGPAFSQTRGAAGAAPHVEVRAVSAGASLLTGPTLSLAPVSGLSLTAPSLAPAPSLLPVAAAPVAAPAARAALTAASADAPRLPVSAAPAGEAATGRILEQLAPERSADVSGEQAKTLSGALLGEGSAPQDGPRAVPGAESSPASLAPASPLGAPADGPRVPSSPARRAPSLRDHAHHWRLLGQSFWWYMTTNVRNKWRAQRAAWLKAKAEGPVAVSRQREFFAAMRTTGMSGHFYVLGGAALEDEAVVRDMRAAFQTYFDQPSIGAPERSAFEAFMTRAMGYNVEHRSHTYLYKTIRDAMIRASLMRPDQLRGYFDGLIQDSAAQETLDFQNKGEQKRVRDAFRAALLSVLDEEDPLAKDRVVAALVLGSFASGAAGPRSDFDVEVLTANGSDARVKAFSDRILAVWQAAGLHDRHPVSVHDHAARPTRSYLDLVHSADYFIVSRNARLEAALSRAPGERPAFTVDRRRDGRGRAGILLQSAVVHATIWLEELKALGR